MLAISEDAKIYIADLEPNGNIAYISRYNVDSKNLLSYSEISKEFLFENEDNFFLSNQEGNKDFEEFFNAEVDILALAISRYYPNHANQIKRIITGVTVFSEGIKQIDVFYKNQNLIIENGGNFFK